MKHIKKAIVFLIGIIITVFILTSCDIRSINFVDAPAADNTTYTYTGSEITYKIKEESYYTITNNKQTNAGTYDVIISLNNKEKDMWSSTRSSDDLVYKFVIHKKTINKPTAPQTNLVYNGQEQTYNIEASDYYTVLNNKQTNAGTYTLNVALKDKTNYMWNDKTTNDLTYNYTIDKLSIENATINLEADSYTYTGDDITPEVKKVTLGNLELTNNDYDISYSNNISTGQGIITITGKGNFTKSASKSFNIVDAKIEKPKALTTTFTYNGLEQTYNLEESDFYTISNNKKTDAGNYKVTVSLKDKENNTWADGSTNDLEFDFVIGKKEIVKPSAIDNIFTYNGLEQTYNLEESDFYTISNNKQTNAGEYVVNVTLNDIKNTCWNDSSVAPIEFDFIINPLNINTLTLSISDQEYTGSELTPLINDFDTANYDITYENNINVGTAKAFIKAKGNYKGDIEIEFAITPKSIKDATVTFDEATYTGSTITPSITVTLNDIELVLDTDYTFSSDEIKDAKDYIITITAKGNYKDVISKAFTVNKLEITDTASVDDISSISYTGNKIEPTINVKNNDEVLTLNKDYTLTYENNINVGTAKVNVTFIGNYKGSKVAQFEITKLDIKDATITLTDPEYLYTGSEIEPLISSVKVGDLVIENDAYTVEYSNNINIGNEALITITAKDNTNYTGSATKYFTITSNNIDITTASFEYEATYTYTGFEIKPTVIVKIDDVVIEKDNKYNISYEDNINVGTAKIIIEGINNYTGTKKLEFEIIKAKIEKPTASNETFIYSGLEQSYFKTLNDLLNYENNTQTNIGKYEVRVSIKDKDNYCWTDESDDDLTFDFIINAINIDSDLTIFTVEDKTYTGTEIFATITSAKYNNTDLVLGTDYEIIANSYSNNVDVGTAKFTIEGIGIYIGLVNLEFEILPLDISNNITVDPVSNYTYTGNEIRPELTVHYNDELFNSYAVTYSNNTNVGTAKATITLNGNYTGTKDVEFEIVKLQINKPTSIDDTFTYNGLEQTYNLAESNFYTISNNKQTNAGEYNVTVTLNDKENTCWIDDTITDLEYDFIINAKSIIGATITLNETSYVYTGNKVLPNVTVTLNDIGLVLNTDYTVDTTNIDVTSSAEATITGKGNYKDSITTNTYSITQRDINDKNITYTSSNMTFTGSSITNVAFTLKNNLSNTNLINTQDYTIDGYSNNSNVGTASISITAKGNYTGTRNISFEIIKANIADVVLKEAIADQAYTGSAVTPTFSLSLNSYTLLQSDFEYSFEDNIEIGTAKINVVGTGNFTGTNSYTFNITNQVQSYTIEYVLDGGNPLSANPTSYTSEENANPITLNSPEKAGYTFTGWTNQFNDKYENSIPANTNKNLVLTAHYELITYTITYVLNGGVASNSDTYDITTPTFTLNNPTKNGYTFTGWTGSNGDEPNTSITINNGSTGNLTYTANWTINNYTITFDSNGGSDVANIQYTIETKTFNLPESTKEGYTMLWYNGDTAISTITQGQYYTNLNLKAIWTPILYNITYNLDGGNQTNPKTTYTIEDATFTLVAPTKNGYTFTGWTGSNGDTITTPVDVNTGSTGDLTYTAHWDIITYTITYNLNGGTLSNPNPTSYDITTPTFTLNNPTKAGYTFSGWSLNGSSTKTQTITITQGSYDDKEYTANFDLITYNITYELNDGANNSANPASYNITTSPFNLAKPTKDGYSFVNWKLNNNVVTEINPAKNLNDITLEAIFIECPFIIDTSLVGGNDSFDIYDNNTNQKLETFTSNDVITLKNTYVGQSIKFVVTSNNTKIYTGMYNAATQLTTDYQYITSITNTNTKTTVKPTWSDYNVTITQENILDGATINNQYTVSGDRKIGSVVTYTMIIPENYVWFGWFDGNDQLIDDRSLVLNVTLSASTQTFKAKWYTLTDLISYEATGGTGNGAITFTSDYIYGHDITLTATTVENYKFVGWYEGETQLTTDASYQTTLTSHTNTLTAKYIKDMISISRKYKDLSDKTVDVDDTNEYGGTVVSKVIDATNTTITFASYTGFELTSVYIENQTPIVITNNTVTIANPSEEVMYLAVWEPIQYNINYELDGGTNNASNPATYTVLHSTIRLEAPTKDDSEFAHWEENSVIITDSTLTISKDNLVDRTVIAIWLGAKYNILFYENNGATYNSNNYNSKELASGTDLTTSEYTPTRDNYTFDGWYTADGTKVTSSPNASMSLYAYWAEETPTHYFNIDGTTINSLKDTDTKLTEIKFPTYYQGNLITTINMNYSWLENHTIPTTVTSIVFGYYQTSGLLGTTPTNITQIGTSSYYKDDNNVIYYKNGNNYYSCSELTWKIIEKGNSYILLADDIIECSTSNDFETKLTLISNALKAITGNSTITASLPSSTIIGDNTIAAGTEFAKLTIPDLITYLVSDKSLGKYKHWNGTDYQKIDNTTTTGIRPVITVTL